MAWRAAGFLAASWAFCAPVKTLLFEWGNGNYNPRKGFPEDLLNFTNFRPHAVRFFNKVKSPNLTNLAYGETLAAGIDEQGHLYVWHKHSPNNVNLEAVDDKHREVRLLHKGNYDGIAFTKGVLFAVNKRGEVWQWRFDKEEDPPARHIASLTNITQIATGHDHFACLDRDGVVWTMGDDTFGQCGYQSLNRSLSEPYLEMRISNPVQVTGLKKRATMVKCGKQHTLVLLEDGTVYGWGRNQKYQLGEIDLKLGQVAAPLTYEPVKIKASDGGKPVKLIAAGDLFSMFVVKGEDEEEEVFGCGINSRGQLGLGYLSHTNATTKVETMSNLLYKTDNGLHKVQLSQLECGRDHCLALTDIGSIFRWGSNEFGELGNMKRMYQDRPDVMGKFLKYKVKRVVADRTSSAVLVSKA